MFIGLSKPGDTTYLMNSKPISYDEANEVAKGCSCNARPIEYDSVWRVPLDSTPTNFHIWKPALKTDSIASGKLMVITIREGDLYAGRYMHKDSIEIRGDTMQVIDMLIRKLQSQMYNVEVLKKEVEKMREQNKGAYYLWTAEREKVRWLHLNSIKQSNY
jgi:hypothetical protein